MRPVFETFNKAVMMLIMRLTPSCEVITEKVSQSLDHNISLYDRLMIRLHTLECELCARYRSQLITLHRAVEKLSEHFDDLEEIQLPETSKARIKKVLQQNKEQ